MTQLVLETVPEFSEQMLTQLETNRQRLLNLINGLVDPTNLIKMPAARVTHSANQAITSGTQPTLAFDTTEFDTDNMHSTTVNNSRLTCRTAGRYIAGGNYEWAGNVAGYRQIGVFVNGTGIAYVRYNVLDGNQTEIGITTLVQLAVGDYVELSAAQLSGGNLNVNSSAPYSPKFWIARVG